MIVLTEGQGSYKIESDTMTLDALIEEVKTLAEILKEKETE